MLQPAVQGRELSIYSLAALPPLHPGRGSNARPMPSDWMSTDRAEVALPRPHAGPTRLAHHPHVASAASPHRQTTAVPPTANEALTVSDIETFELRSGYRISASSAAAGSWRAAMGGSSAPSSGRSRGFQRKQGSSRSIVPISTPAWKT
mgnify:CR=1 FL=1